jgi:hypothetical protein
MHMSHEEYLENERLKLTEILAKVIDGKYSILLAARQIVQLFHEIDFDENDKDLLVFIGIDSESDNLPIGPEKTYWSEDALRNKEKEIEKTEKWALDVGIEACKNLLQKLAKETT